MDKQIPFIITIRQEWLILHLPRSVKTHRHGQTYSELAEVQSNSQSVLVTSWNGGSIHAKVLRFCHPFTGKMFRSKYPTLPQSAPQRLTSSHNIKPIKRWVTLRNQQESKKNSTAGYSKKATNVSPFCGSVPCRKRKHGPSTLLAIYPVDTHYQPLL